MAAHKYNPILQMEKLRPREVSTGQHSKTIDENWGGGGVWGFCFLRPGSEVLCGSLSWVRKPQQT